MNKYLLIILWAALFSVFAPDLQAICENNQRPAAAAQLSGALIAGSPITFDASSSTDPNNNIKSYLWIWGDGTSSPGRTVNHVYSSAGNYTTQLIVTDECRLRSNKWITLTILPNANSSCVNNQRPTVEAGPSRDFKTGEVIYFRNFMDIWVKDAESNNKFMISWNFGDGSSEAGLYPTHAYAQAGNYTLTLRAKDECGAESSDTALFRIVNPATAPQVSADFSISGSLQTYEYVTFQAAQAPKSNHLFSWEFGDALVQRMENRLVRRFSSPESYQVKLTIYDLNTGLTVATRIKPMTIAASAKPLSIPPSDYVLKGNKTYIPLRVECGGDLNNRAEIVGGGCKWDKITGVMKLRFGPYTGGTVTSSAYAINDFGQTAAAKYSSKGREFLIADGTNLTFLYESGPIYTADSSPYIRNGFLNDRGDAVYTLASHQSGRIVGWKTWYRSAGGETIELGNNLQLKSLNNLGQVLTNNSIYDPYKGWMNASSLYGLPSGTSFSDFNDQYGVTGNLYGTYPFYFDGAKIFFIPGIKNTSGTQGLPILLEAQSLNNHGQVFGRRWNPQEPIGLFIYDPQNGSRVLEDLIPVRWLTNQVKDLFWGIIDTNDLGQILVEAQNTGRWFLVEAGDFDLDGMVEASELAFIQGCFNQTTRPECKEADLDLDGAINQSDLAIAQGNAE